MPNVRRAARLTIRLPRSSLLVAASAALVVVLVFAAMTEAPLVPLDRIASFEGQGDVRVEGLVQNLHEAADGSLRFTIVAGLHKVEVRTSEPAVATNGAWTRVTGRVLRNANELTLWSEPSGIELHAAPSVASPSWRDVAEHPENWVGTPLHLVGTVQSGALRDKDGHALAIEPGAWPPGPANVTGSITFKPACVCYRIAPLGNSNGLPVNHA